MESVLPERACTRTSLSGWLAGKPPNSSHGSVVETSDGPGVMAQSRILHRAFLIYWIENEKSLRTMPMHWRCGVGMRCWCDEDYPSTCV